jgi:hypothetical protein
MREANKVVGEKRKRTRKRRRERNTTRGTGMPVKKEDG